MARSLSLRPGAWTLTRPAATLSTPKTHLIRPAPPSPPPMRRREIRWARESGLRDRPPHEPSTLPPGFGLRQPSGAFASRRVEKRQRTAALQNAVALVPALFGSRPQCAIRESWKLSMNLLGAPACSRLFAVGTAKAGHNRRSTVLVFQSGCEVCRLSPIRRRNSPGETKTRWHPACVRSKAGPDNGLTM